MPRFAVLPFSALLLLLVCSAVQAADPPDLLTGMPVMPLEPPMDHFDRFSLEEEDEKGGALLTVSDAMHKIKMDHPEDKETPSLDLFPVTDGPPVVEITTRPTFIMKINSKSPMMSALLNSSEDKPSLLFSDEKKPSETKESMLAFGEVTTLPTEMVTKTTEAAKPVSTETAKPVSMETGKPVSMETAKPVSTEAGTTVKPTEAVTKDKPMETTLPVVEGEGLTTVRPPTVSSMKPPTTAMMNNKLVVSTSKPMSHKEEHEHMQADAPHPESHPKPEPKPEPSHKEEEKEHVQADAPHPEPHPEPEPVSTTKQPVKEVMVSTSKAPSPAMGMDNKSTSAPLVNTSTKKPMGTGTSAASSSTPALLLALIALLGTRLMC